MATRTDGQAAHDYLLSFEPLENGGYCWHYVWNAYARAGASTGMGSTPTAYAGWNATSGKHPGDWNPPPGAAIWLGRRYDGNMDGDVFIAGGYDGDHAATDEPGWYETGTTSIEARMNLCGREYLGWTDHVLDCPIDLGGTPEPDPEPEENDVSYSIVPDAWGPEIYVMSLTTGLRKLISTPEDVALLTRARDNDGSDHMAWPELEIVHNYLKAINPGSIPTPPAADPAQQSHTRSLVAPAWFGGSFLALIGLIELIRFVGSNLP